MDKPNDCVFQTYKDGDFWCTTHHCLGIGKRDRIICTLQDKPTQKESWEDDFDRRFGVNSIYPVEVKDFIRKAITADRAVQQKKYERIIDEVIGEDEPEAMFNLTRNELREEQRQRAKELLKEDK